MSALLALRVFTSIPEFRARTNMANLFIRTEGEWEPAPRPRVTVPYIGSVSTVDPIVYPEIVHIEQIKPTAGSTRTRKVYSVVQLNEIILRLFGFKHKSATDKESAVAFLMLPESLVVINRHNERVQEAKRARAVREMANTPKPYY